MTKRVDTKGYCLHSQGHSFTATANVETQNTPNNS